MTQQLRTLAAQYLEDQSSVPSIQIVQFPSASGDLMFFSIHAHILYVYTDKQT